MIVVIPVAGAGTRLRPHTLSLPKPLLHVAGRPIIDHLLEPVVKLNPDEVRFVVGYMGEQIKDHVQNNYQFKATFVTQDKLLGLGYALNLALADCPPGELLILLGDTIVECDLPKFVQAGDNVLGLMPVDDPQRFGIAEVTDGRVVALEEKPANPKTNLAVIGLYYFKDSTLVQKTLAEHVASGQKTRGEIQFTDALQSMIEQGAEFAAYEVNEWFDCGKKETMLSTNRHLVSAIGQTPTVEDSCVIAPVFVDPSARVINSVIGPNVSISAGSVVSNSIVRETIIGKNSTIDNMILQETLIGHQATVKGKGRSLNLGDFSESTPGE